MLLLLLLLLTKDRPNRIVFHNRQW